MHKALPADFTTQMQSQLGDAFKDFISALEEPPPVSVRFNPFKKTETGLDGDSISWASDAIYIDKKKSFTADPLFHAGVYYVQEASSMLIEQVFKTAFPDSYPSIVLDLCAAPGGKSTHLLSLMNDEGVLISNEIHPQRNSILKQNLVRWGCSNQIITKLAAEQFKNLQETVDLLLCDAPCSGEGMFRKDPDAIDEWSMNAVLNCSARQTQILNHATDLVKKGGFLIYSTCTYNSFENDDQIKQLLFSDEWKLISLDLQSTGAVQTQYGWQCYPHRVRGEGLYISLLQKITGSEIDITSALKKNKNESKSSLEIPIGFKLIEHRNILQLIPEKHASLMSSIGQLIPLVNTGTTFGELKGKDFIPAHEYALSCIPKSEYPAVELNLEFAIRFLRCETFPIREAKNGWNLIQFHNQPMGWIKSVPGRINNYYPKSWRILKELNKLL